MTARRQEIRFSSWMPVAADRSIAYSYVNPRTGNRVRVGGDNWTRAKWQIAEAAIWSGATSFLVSGGLGDRRWQRDVTISQEEADAFFQEASKSGFMLRGIYKRACRARVRRLERATNGD